MHLKSEKNCPYCPSKLYLHESLFGDSWRCTECFYIDGTRRIKPSSATHSNKLQGSTQSDCQQQTQPLA
jgi:hypothetical protein